MQITNFSILPDSLLVEISDAEQADSLFIWNESTYKNIPKALDFSDKLNGNSVQSISITFEELNILEIEGIYIVQVDSDTDMEESYVYDIDHVRECILDSLLRLDICGSCKEVDTSPVTNAQSLLLALEDALDLNRLLDSICILNSLNKYCKNKCKNCN